MKFLLIFVFLIILFFGKSNIILAQSNLEDSFFAEMNESGDIVFPAGTMFKTILPYKISTEFNNIDNIIKLNIPSDIYFGDITCIPKNSFFSGRIEDLQKAKTGQNGYLLILFNSLKTPDGQNIPVQAHIWTKKGDGVLGGEATGRTTYRKVPHYIDRIGKVAQLVPDGPKKMGIEKELPPGAELIIVLDRELKLNLIKND